MSTNPCSASARSASAHRDAAGGEFIADRLLAEMMARRIMPVQDALPQLALDLQPQVVVGRLALRSSARRRGGMTGTGHHGIIARPPEGEAMPKVSAAGIWTSPTLYTIWHRRCSAALPAFPSPLIQPSELLALMTAPPPHPPLATRARLASAGPGRFAPASPTLPGRAQNNTSTKPS